MSMMKSFYNITYRYFRAPWDIGPRKELVELVEAGRLKPCKAIDLGSGTASNVVFLAGRGFDVTGVDFAQAAVELGLKRAAEDERRHRDRTALDETTGKPDGSRHEETEGDPGERMRKRRLGGVQRH